MYDITGKPNYIPLRKFVGVLSLTISLCCVLFTAVGCGTCIGIAASANTTDHVGPGEACGIGGPIGAAVGAIIGFILPLVFWCCFCQNRNKNY
jgi:hypothetical protein